MGWRCGSIGRTPVLQVQSPEFTPQSHQIKKKKKKKLVGNETIGNQYGRFLKKFRIVGRQWLTPVISGGRDQEDHSLKSAWANSL
jgi:hypothetical protein